MVTPTPQTQSATRLNRLSAGATKHSAELQNLLLPNGTGPGSRTQGRTSTALTVATDDRPETTAGSKPSPPPCPLRRPRAQASDSRLYGRSFFNVGIIHLRVLPAPPDLFPPFTPAGKIQPQSLKEGELRKLLLGQGPGHQVLNLVDPFGLVVTTQQVDSIPIGVATVPVFVNFLPHAERGHAQVVSQPEQPEFLIDAYSLTSHVLVQIPAQLGAG